MLMLSLCFADIKPMICDYDLMKLHISYHVHCGPNMSTDVVMQQVMPIIHTTH